MLSPPLHPSRAYCTLAEILYERGQITEALDYHYLALRVRIQELGEHNRTAASYYKLGLIFKTRAIDLDKAKFGPLPPALPLSPLSSQLTTHPNRLQGLPSPLGRHLSKDGDRRRALRAVPVPPLVGVRAVGRGGGVGQGEGGGEGVALGGHGQGTDRERGVSRGV